MAISRESHELLLKALGASASTTTATENEPANAAGAISPPSASLPPTQPSVQPVAPVGTLQQPTQSAPGWEGVDRWNPTIDQVALEYPSVPKQLVRAIIKKESGGDPNVPGPITKYGQAKGLGQFIDQTAQQFVPGWTGPQDSYDPEKNIRGIFAYAEHNLNRFGGDVAKAAGAHFGSGLDPVLNKTSDQYSNELMELYNQDGGAPSQYSPSSGLRTSPESQDLIRRALAGEQLNLPQAAPSESDIGAGSAMASAGVAGLAGLTKSFYSTPAGAASAVLLGANTINKVINGIAGQKIFDDEMQTPKFLTENKLVQGLAQIEKEQSARAKTRFKPGDNAAQMISQGRIGNLAEYVGQAVVQNAPTSVAMGAMIAAAVPKITTLALLYLSTAGSKEVDNADKVASGEISPWKAQISSQITGLSEAGFSAAGEYKVLDAMTKAFKGMAAEVGEKAARETIKKTMEKVAKGFMKGAGREVPTEAMTQFSQDLTDKVTGVRPDITVEEMYQNAFLEAGLPAAVLGGLPGGVTGGVESRNIARQQRGDQKPNVTLSPSDAARSDEAIRGSMTGQTLADAGMTDEQFLTLATTDRKKAIEIYRQLSGEEAKRISDLAQSMEEGKAAPDATPAPEGVTPKPPAAPVVTEEAAVVDDGLSQIERDAVAAVSKQTPGIQPAPVKPPPKPVDTESFEKVKSGAVSGIESDQQQKLKELNKELYPNREARRAAVESGMVVEPEETIVDKIKNEFGETRPTKAHVVEKFGVSREEAGKHINAAYPKIEKPVAPVEEVEPSASDQIVHLSEEQIATGRELSSKISGIKFDGEQPGIKNVKPTWQITDLKTGSTFYVDPETGDKGIRSQLLQLRKRFKDEEDKSTPTKGADNGLQGKTDAETPGQKTGEKVVPAIPPEPKVETVTATQPEVVAPPVAAPEPKKKEAENEPAKPKEKVEPAGLAAQPVSGGRKAPQPRKPASARRTLKDEDYAPEYNRVEHAHESNVDLYNALRFGWKDRGGKDRPGAQKGWIDDYNLITDSNLPGGSKNPELSQNAKDYLQDVVDNTNENLEYVKELEALGIKAPQHTDDVIEMLRGSLGTVGFHDFHKGYEKGKRPADAVPSKYEDAIRNFNEDPFSLSAKEVAEVEEYFGAPITEVVDSFGLNEETYPKQEKPSRQLSPDEMKQQDLFGEERSVAELEQDEESKLRKNEIQSRIEKRKGGEAPLSGLPMFDDQDFEGSQGTLKFAKAGQAIDIERTIPESVYKKAVAMNLEKVLAILPKGTKSKIKLSIVNEIDWNGGKVRFGMDTDGSSRNAAMFWDRKNDTINVWLSKDLTSSEIAKSMMHELPGHYGSKLVYAANEDIYRKMRTIFQDEIDGGKVKGLEKVYAKELESSKSRMAKEEILFDEWTASKVTDYLNGKKDGIVSKVFGYIRYALVKMGVLRENVEDVLREMVKLMKRGGKVIGESTGASYSKSVTDQTKTEAFKKWFAGSKVVDENGDPLVVYHGTDAEFNEFITKGGSKRKTNQQLDFGAHLTGDEEYAKGYSKKGVTMPLYVTIKNPLNLSDGKEALQYVGDKNFNAIQKVRDLLKIKNNGDMFYDRNGIKHNDVKMTYINQSILDSYPPQKVKDALKDAGFDGVIYEPYNKVGLHYAKKHPKSYIAFSPNQIKSATGNRGTFDPKNPDIRFAKGAPMTEPAPENEPNNPKDMEARRKKDDALEDNTIENEQLLEPQLSEPAPEVDNPQGVKPAKKPDVKKFSVINFEKQISIAVAKKLADAGRKFKWSDVGGETTESRTDREIGVGIYQYIKEFAENPEFDGNRPTGRELLKKLQSLFEDRAAVDAFLKFAGIDRTVKTPIAAADQQATDDGDFENLSEMVDDRAIGKEKASEELSFAQQLKKEREMREMLHRIRTENDFKPVKREFREYSDRILSDLFVPISTAMEKLHPKFKAKLRTMQTGIDLKTNQDAKAVEPLLKKMKDLRKRDALEHLALDLSLKNATPETAGEIFKKHGMESEYKAARKVLDDLHRRAADAGFDINYIPHYWPRKVINAQGLLAAVESDKALWGPIEKVISAEEERLKRKLDDYEKAKLVDVMLQRPDLSMDAPGAIKKRSIRMIDDQLDKFYDDGMSALVTYIHEMNDSIGIKKTLGKGGEGPEKLTNIDEGIGRLILDAKEQGWLKPEDQDQLIGLWKARFNYKPSGGAVQKIKELGYFATMGSGWSSFISQLVDLAWSVYVAGPMRTAGAAAKAFVGASKLKREDVGIGRLIEEFRTTRGFGQWLNRTFKATGLDHFDRMGKEAFINALRSKWQQQAKAGNKELTARVKMMFEDEANQVLADLQNGKASDNVKMLLASRLLDFQPAALSEMPRKYLEMPNGRIFYMLKTFTIKQLDAFRNEGLHFIRKGIADKDPAMVRKGMINLMTLASLFFVAGIGTDMIKDWLFFRKTDLDDRFVENLMKLIGISRFTLYDLKDNGGNALINTVAPPINLIADPGRDIFSYFHTRIGDEFDERKDMQAKDFATWKSLPLVGKHWYWMMGGGKEKQVRKQKKSQNEEFKEYAKKFYAPRLHSSDRDEYKKWYIKLDDTMKGEFAAYAKRWYSMNKENPAIVKRITGK